MKTDKRTEANRRQLQDLEQYCTERELNATLSRRLRAYFEFQQRKRRVADEQVMKLLPRGLYTKICAHMYTSVLERNRFLFFGCNPQFLNQVLSRLREVHLMPSELLVQQRDMSRELVFLTAGVLEVCKESAAGRPVLVRNIRAESEAPSVAGEVAFFMSVAQLYTVVCNANSDATCLVLS